METTITNSTTIFKLNPNHYQSFNHSIEERLIDLINNHGSEVIEWVYCYLCSHLDNMDLVCCRLEFMFDKLFVRKIKIWDVEEIYGVYIHELENEYIRIEIDENCYIFHHLPF